MDNVQEGTRSSRSAAQPVDERRHALVERTVRSDVRAMARYAVTPAAGFVKLDAMENPYALPSDVRRSLASVLADVAVNRYPDGDAAAVKQALRRSLDLPDDVALMLGNGSDEIIQIVTAAVAAPGAVVLAPEPSFVMYRRNAQIAHARFVAVPLRGDFDLDIDAMLAAIATHGPALIWLALPNNPTGNLFDEAAIEKIIAAAPGLVALDEAYYAFAERSMLARVLEFPNVVVVRTVSKIGFAGLRLGYVAGHRAWIDELEKIRPPYNVNSLTQAALPLLLAQRDAFDRQASAIRAERARLRLALGRFSGVRTFATQTNFVLARVPDAGRWFATLRDARILVKNLNGWHPLLVNCLRIPVGTPEENDALIAALERAYGAGSTAEAARDGERR